MQKIVAIGLIILAGVVVNFSLLYFMLFNMRSDINGLHEQLLEKNIVISPVSSQMQSPAQTASVSAQTSCTTCQNDIAEIKKILSTLTPTGTSFTSTPKSASSQVKEVFIPLGSGTTTSSDWADIPGISATIDSSNYSRIKSVLFEVALRIPTANGTVYARLFNKTDQHPVWYSEVSSEGPVSTVKQASNITLDSGSKLYQLQMKSTLQFEAVADSASVKIVLQ